MPDIEKLKEEELYVTYQRSGWTTAVRDVIELRKRELELEKIVANLYKSFDEYSACLGVTNNKLEEISNHAMALFNKAEIRIDL